MIRRSLGTCVLLLLACGPEGSDDGTGTSDADTTTGSSSTPTTSGGSANECGPVPTPAACTPTEPGDPRVAVCAMRDEAGCPGSIDDAGGECRWVTTTTYAHDATTCEAPKTGGACVALSYFGDGCESVTACGGNTDDTVFYRTDAACQTEVFRGGFCGYTLLGWNFCAWDTSASERCTLPHPTQGPALCNCAC